MGLFKKKEKKVEVVQEEVKTEVVNANLDNKVEVVDMEESTQANETPAPERELTKEEKTLIEQINWYNKKYGLFYGVGDVVQLTDAHLKAEQMNLLFGILCELKELNEKRK